MCQHATVAVPDLQICGVPDHPDPGKRRGPALENNFSLPFGPQFDRKIRWGPWPLGPSPRYANVLCSSKHLLHKYSLGWQEIRGGFL